MSAVHPRLRGELGKRTSGFFPLRRFIPACAGNSLQTILISLVRSVHPRLRGELFPFHSATYVQPGSSPLARGTQNRCKHAFDDDRFIPACAGNSKMKTYEIPLNSVHPRLRGELRVCKLLLDFGFGSSPLARGTQICCLITSTDTRFIPACAGNSRSNFSFGSSMSVHPRLRGELLLTTTYTIDKHGSSPLARGTLEKITSDAIYARFIPACAGNSKTKARELIEVAVHPRLRGELT